MYFSTQGKPEPGIVATTVAIPLQSIIVRSWLHYWVTYTRAGTAATPYGPVVKHGKGSWMGRRHIGRSYGLGDGGTLTWIGGVKHSCER